MYTFLPVIRLLTMNMITFQKNDPEMVIWTRRMQFWQPWPNIFAQYAQNFYEFLKSFRKFFPWTDKNEFWEDQFLSKHELTVLKAASSHPRVPMLFLMFWAVSFLGQFLPTVYWKYRRAASLLLPVVLHQFEAKKSFL